jgi:hypothetical protein
MLRGNIWKQRDAPCWSNNSRDMEIGQYTTVNESNKSLEYFLMYLLTLHMYLYVL